jgi:hypothetical protein
MRLPVRSIVAGAALCVVASTLAAAPVGAAQGDLTTTWASGGTLSLPWSFGPVRNSSMIASSPGGNLFLVGDDGALGCVTRLTPLAALDPGFSTTPGLVGSVCDFDGGANGRMVVAQPTGTGGLVSAAVTAANRFVARIDSTGGYQLTELPGNYAGDGGQLLDITPMSDGRTALLETHDATGTGHVTIVEESGAFAGEFEVPSPDVSHAFEPHQVLAGPGGTLLLVGELETASGTITAILRTDAEGRPDTSFSTDGYTDGPPSASARPGRGAVGPDGRVVLAAASGTSVGVRRITTAGAIDATFSTSGSAAALPTATVGIGGVVVRPDNRVYLSFDGSGTSTAVNVARLTAAGALDTTFAGDGYASVDAGVGHLRGATSAALAPYGDLYVLATDGTGTDDPVVLRFNGTPLPPVPSMTRPTSVWNLSSSVALAWTATGGATVLNTDVRTRRAPYNALAPTGSVALLTETAARSRTVTGVPGGTTLCASTRARDIWAQISEWSAQRCTSVPLTPAQLTKGKGVTAKAAAGTYAGKVLSATKKGATITRTGVKAKRLAIVVTTCSSCGKVKVYLGSDLLRTVSLKSSGTRRKVVVSIATFASMRSGTVKIKVVSSGKKVLVEGLGVSKV